MQASPPQTSGFFSIQLVSIDILPPPAGPLSVYQATVPGERCGDRAAVCWLLRSSYFPIQGTTDFSAGCRLGPLALADRFSQGEVFQHFRKDVMKQLPLLLQRFDQ